MDSHHSGGYLHKNGSTPHGETGEVMGINAIVFSGVAASELHLPVDKSCSWKHNDIQWIKEKTSKVMEMYSNKLFLFYNFALHSTLGVYLYTVEDKDTFSYFLVG